MSSHEKALRSTRDMIYYVSTTNDWDRFAALPHEEKERGVREQTCKLTFFAKNRVAPGLSQYHVTQAHTYIISGLHSADSYPVKVVF